MIVKAPASSANLGPGFDCFGIAWKCYNTIEFEKSSTLEISGCDSRFINADNLAYQAYARTMQYLGLKPDNVRIVFGETDIPVSRGLGSSAALISAGVYAAYVLNDIPVDRYGMLAVATEIEGHPDNVAPAIFGGFSASAMKDGKAYTTRFELSDKLSYTAVIPDFELETKVARSVLPQTYTKADAVFNISRAALVIGALTKGDIDLLSVGMEDKIHQPYRFPLIAGSDRIRDLMKNYGKSVMCISGSGSTMLCVSEHMDLAERLRKDIGSMYPGWKVLSLEPDTNGISQV